MTRQREICIDLQRGDSLQIDQSALPLDSDKTCITLEHKSGQIARLRIKADESVSIRRITKGKQPATT